MSLCKRLLSFFLLLLPLTSLFSQDSTGLKGWTVESKKTGEGKFELLFNLPDAQGWQLYAPNQSPGDVKTVEMIFTDSAIKQDDYTYFTTVNHQQYHL